MVGSVQTKVLAGAAIAGLGAVAAGNALVSEADRPLLNGGFALGGVVGAMIFSSSFGSVGQMAATKSGAAILGGGAALVGAGLVGAAVSNGGILDDAF